MKRIILPLAILGSMVGISYAVADEVVSDAGIAQQQKSMKDCMAKHAASNDRMTKDDIEKACKEEMKSHGGNSTVSSKTPQK